MAADVGVHGRPPPAARSVGTRGKPPGCEKGAPRPVPTAMHIGTRVFRSCASPPPPPPGRAVDPFTQPPPRPGLDGLASCPVGLRPPAPRARALAACPARDRRGSRAPHRRPVVLASRYIHHHRGGGRRRGSSAPAPFGSPYLSIHPPRPRRCVLVRRSTESSSPRRRSVVLPCLLSGIRRGTNACPLFYPPVQQSARCRLCICIKEQGGKYREIVDGN